MGLGEEQAHSVERVPRVLLVVAGVARNSKVYNSMHQGTLVIVVSPLAMAPKSHKLIDAMEYNSQ